jgi:hypothetical protein
MGVPGFDCYLKVLPQHEEMPGFVKRHTAINAKNIIRFEDFSACGEELAMAA